MLHRDILEKVYTQYTYLIELELGSILQGTIECLLIFRKLRIHHFGCTWWEHQYWLAFIGALLRPCAT